MRPFKRLIILGATVLVVGAVVAAVSFGISKFFPDKDPVYTTPPYETPVVDNEPPLESLEVKNVTYLKTQDGRYDIVITLVNPNPEHGAEEILYSVSFLKDASEVKKFNETTYILPREEKYIVLTNLEVSGSFTDVKVDINAVTWRQLQEFVELNLDVFDIKLERMEFPSTFYARLRAFVKNNSVFGLTDIRVVGVLFDSEKNIIGANRTSIQTVLEGETREVEMFWQDEIPMDDVATFTVEAYSNVLKNENFVRQYGMKEGAPGKSPGEAKPTNYFQLPEIFDRFKGWNPF